MIMLRELQASDPQFAGPYRLRGLLGAGGMGRVFLGVSPGGEPVAVKVIRADLATDREFRERFRREVATRSARRAISSAWARSSPSPPRGKRRSAAGRPRRWCTA